MDNTGHRPRTISPTHSRASSASGFSIVELTIVMVILVVGLGAMASTLATVSRLAPINRETSRALDAARGVVEQMQGVPFDEVFARYNADPADDPAPPAAAPGNSFAAPGLQVRPDDPDGVTGAIEFPAAGGELREDLDDPRLGFPRDLNGDGVVDALDHSSDYQILPVRVRVEWRGQTGDRALEIHSALIRPQ